MLENFRLRLAAVDALPQLSLLAVLVGLLAGGVIVLFRYLIEQGQFLILNNIVEDYTVLSPLFLVLLTTIGGFLIGLILQTSSSEQRPVGVVHVIERLSYHQGYLPFRNALNQFTGAAISLISGHSIGREGPGVHLGAASGSLLGQWLKLPNNSLRTLVACGTAAAIAASFNTPLAGVIFAMEVVMMEYSIISFTPVILASVVGTLVTQSVYGNEGVFNVTSLLFHGALNEFPLLLLFGVVIGILAALFIHILQTTAVKSAPYNLIARLTGAGFFTGLIALLTPEVMGVGYQTVNMALVGELGLTVLVVLTFTKLIITAVGLGLGLPGGLIGPTLFIGAMAGGAIGSLSQQWFPETASDVGFYAMLGMGAMMGAVLQAPLAALTALLELTLNPNIILPGMLVIVISNIVTRSPPFNKISVFLTLLKAKGFDYRNDPVAQALRRQGVTHVMQRNFVEVPRLIKVAEIHEALSKSPEWIVVSDDDTRTLTVVADVVLAIQESGLDDEDNLDLLAIPAQRQQLGQLPSTNNLQQALNELDSEEYEALVIIDRHQNPIGVVTRQAIERHYHTDF
jgi:CIC family chloride channel protein